MTNYIGMHTASFVKKLNAKSGLLKKNVHSEILKSNGNSNSIWKILNRCIPKKNVPLATVENPFLVANKFNKFYADNKF